MELQTDKRKLCDDILELIVEFEKKHGVVYRLTDIQLSFSPTLDGSVRCVGIEGDIR